MHVIMSTSPSLLNMCDSYINVDSTKYKLNVVVFSFQINIFM